MVLAMGSRKVQKCGAVPAERELLDELTCNLRDGVVW